MSDLIDNRFRTELSDEIGAANAAFGSEDITALHRSLPRYAPTPLHELPSLAARLGIGRLLVKDESHRFGLKAFKALGATYAVYRFLNSYLHESGRPCPPADRFYSTPQLLDEDELTLCTATDGNHGRGVAWVARLLNQKAVIYMPAGTVPARIDNVRREGARVEIVDGNYDQAVRRCASEAESNGWHLISDTSWEGYELIPCRIMAGYLTLFREIDAALEENARIDLVLVQGGVGALAAAAAWFFSRLWRNSTPILVSVEPVQAACLAESIASPEGQPIVSQGMQDSLMAGLNCGTPSTVAWPYIRAGFDSFLTVPDEVAVEAMNVYYHPEEDDPRIESGESGAAGLGGLLRLARGSASERDRISLSPEATVLVLNTEGATDPENFARLVAHPA